MFTQARRIRCRGCSVEASAAREEARDPGRAQPRRIVGVDPRIELCERHGFSLPRDALKVALNTRFSDWGRAVGEGDTVVFIPPVAGG